MDASQKPSAELPRTLSAAWIGAQVTSLELCDEYLDHVEAIWRQSPATALAPAEDGVALARRLVGSPAGRMESELRMARALSVLGGVRRSLGLHDAAEAAFHLAAELLITVGDPLRLADLARRLATLRRDQQRFDEARRLGEWALACYELEADGRHRAHTLVELGIVLGYGYRDSEATERCFRGALEHLDPVEDALYYRCAVHNLANTLCRGGDAHQLAELEDWLERARALGGFEPGSPGALNARWLEGLMASHRGDAHSAETALLEARKGFLALGLAVDAATVAMDLACLYLESGRGTEARRLGGELFPIFQALRSQRELSAALSLYVSAAMRDRLSLEIVRQLRCDIAASGWLPSLPA